MASLNEDAFEDDEGDLDWCVDRNPALCAMTTAEIYSAAAEGKLSRETRAWRVGLEAWTKLSEIPELAGAFEEHEVEATSETGVTPPAVQITPVPASVAEVWRARPRRWGPPPLVNVGQRRSRGSITRKLRGAFDEARWIVAGAAIAAASIGLSLTASSPPEPVAVADSSTSLVIARSITRAVADIVAAEATRTKRTLESERAASRSVAELGQRRLRGHGRGRGR